MAHDLLIESASVAVAITSGTTYRFTLSDTCMWFTTPKMIRSVLWDAVGLFLNANSAQLTTNGDGDLLTNWDKSSGDVSKSIEDIDQTFNGKYLELTLTANTSIVITTPLTPTPPFYEV